MTIDPVALLKRYHAALEPYDRAAVAAMLGAGAVYVSPGVGGRLEGRQAILAAFDAYFGEHPDQTSEDLSIRAEGPLSASADWQLIATSRFTGARVKRRGRETVHFDSDGLIAAVEVEDA